MHPYEAAVDFLLKFVRDKQHDGDYAHQAQRHLDAIEALDAPKPAPPAPVVAKAPVPVAAPAPVAPAPATE